MSARSLFALLVVVVLGLLLISATALSRSEILRFDPSGTIDGIAADDGPDDGPEELPSGDDDNWDKPAPSVGPTVDEFGADETRGRLGPELPGEKSPRPVSSLRTQLRLLLRAWGIFFGIR